MKFRIFTKFSKINRLVEAYFYRSEIKKSLKSVTLSEWFISFILMSHTYCYDSYRSIKQSINQRPNLLLMVLVIVVFNSNVLNMRFGPLWGKGLHVVELFFGTAFSGLTKATRCG